MIVRTLDEVIGSDDDVSGEGWNSRRLLLRKHGMGYTVADTIIPKGAELDLWYKNHLEAVYCIEGKGEVESRETGEKWPIEPGTIYALNENDKHTLRSFETLRFVCVFNPPLTGRESHDADGSYNLPDDMK